MTAATTWELNKAFWEQPTRPDWSPGAGGMCMHSIATWPGDPSRIALAISAVGVWLSDDGGQSWRHGNKGLYPRYMPEEARADTIDLCVHNMHRAPTRPERLFMQFHGGVYRSDDAGESWTLDRGRTAVGLRLPDGDRPGRPRQRLRHPARRGPGSHDAGGSRPRLRDARRRRDLDRARRRSARRGRLPHDPPPGVLRERLRARTWSLYFGATSGDVFGSGDAGATWFTAATNLPPVHSVRVA